MNPPKLIMSNGQNPGDGIKDTIHGAVRRLSHPLLVMPPHVKADVKILLKAVAMAESALKAMQGQIANLHAELGGARQTLMAVAKSSDGQTFQVNFSDVESLKPTDALQAEDIKRDDGSLVRIYTFVPSSEESESEPADPQP